jgi:hypothetical protein
MSLIDFITAIKIVQRYMMSIVSLICAEIYNNYLQYTLLYDLAELLPL